MRSPTIHGVIDRRILLNYRVQPEVLSRALPAPFRPQVINGWGIAGVCLIRLRDVRPPWIPSWLGIGSENGAFRAAVEWDSADGPRTGVFVWRRVTSSRLNAMAGGRIFPGVHQRRAFEVDETDESFHVRAIDPATGRAELDVRTTLTDSWQSQIFASQEGSDSCMCIGSLGYSPGRNPISFEGLRLEMCEPRFESLLIEHARVAFFEDPSRFPSGSIDVDHALLMRNISHRWISQPPLSAENFSDSGEHLSHNDELSAISE